MSRGWAPKCPGGAPRHPGSLGAEEAAFGGGGGVGVPAPFHVGRVPLLQGPQADQIGWGGDIRDMLGIVGDVGGSLGTFVGSLGTLTAQLEPGSHLFQLHCLPLTPVNMVSAGEGNVEEGVGVTEKGVGGHTGDAEVFSPRVPMSPTGLK